MRSDNSGSHAPRIQTPARRPRLSAAHGLRPLRRRQPGGGPGRECFTRSMRAGSLPTCWLAPRPGHERRVHRLPAANDCDGAGAWPNLAQPSARGHVPGEPDRDRRRRMWKPRSSGARSRPAPARPTAHSVRRPRRRIDPAAPRRIRPSHRARGPALGRTVGRCGGGLRVDSRDLSARGDGGHAAHRRRRGQRHPISHAIELGAERIYVLPAQHPSQPLARVPKNALDASIYGLGLLIGSRLKTDIDRYSNEAELIVMPAPNTGHVQPTSFEHSGVLISEALAAGRRLLRPQHSGTHLRLVTEDEEDRIVAELERGPLDPRPAAACDDGGLDDDLRTDGVQVGHGRHRAVPVRAQVRRTSRPAPACGAARRYAAGGSTGWMDG